MEAVSIPEEDQEVALRHISVQSCIARLRDKEYFALTRYYGIDCDRRYTLFEIGKMMKRSSERVRQIRYTAEKKLKLIMSPDVRLHPLRTGERR